MVTTVTRRLEFDAAHRVLGHEGKCKHLHGHRYVCEITVRANGLDNLGRVVDFGVVKERVGTWVDTHWDHNALLNATDPLWTNPEARDLAFPQVGPYLFNGNPTAENIAAELFRIATKLLPPPLEVVGVVVWETPNCRAECTP